MEPVQLIGTKSKLPISPLAEKRQMRMNAINSYGYPGITEQLWKEYMDIADIEGADDPLRENTGLWYANFAIYKFHAYVAAYTTAFISMDMRDGFTRPLRAHMVHGILVRLHDLMTRSSGRYDEADYLISSVVAACDQIPVDVGLPAWRTLLAVVAFGAPSFDYTRSMALIRLYLDRALGFVDVQIIRNVLDGKPPCTWSAEVRDIASSRIALLFQPDEKRRKQQ